MKPKPMRRLLPRLMPRAPLTTDRRTGGAHTVRRELSAREELTLRLNEMEAEGRDDFEELRDLFGDEDDEYFDYLITKLGNAPRDL